MSQLQDNLNEILRQKNAYLIPNNLRSGITLLGVDGNLSLDVKKFATKEEMMADTVEDENELGLVYGPKITTLHDGASASAILFPSEVVFDTAVTTNKYMEVEMSVGGEWYNVHGDIYVEYTETPGANFRIGDAYIEYETSDKITFTVKEAYADVADKEIDLPVEITFTSRYGAIPDEIFAFVKGDSNYFEGLYEWKDEVDYEYVDAVTDITVDTTNKRVASVNSEVYLHQTFEEFIREVLPNYVDNPIPEGTEGLCYRVKSTGDIWLVTHTSSCYPVIDVTTKNVYISVSVPNNIGYKYKMNLEEGTISDYTVMPLDDVNITGAYGFPATCQLLGNLSNIEILGDIFYHLTSGDMTIFGGYIGWYFVTNDGQGNLVYNKDDYYTSWYQGEGETQSTEHMIYGHQSFLTWHHVKTEFTLEHSYQLLPGITAMGKHGVVTGDNTIYDHVALDSILDYKTNNHVPYVYSKNGNNRLTVTRKSDINLENLTDAENGFEQIFQITGEFSAPLPEGYSYNGYCWTEHKIAYLIQNTTTSTTKLYVKDFAGGADVTVTVEDALGWSISIPRYYGTFTHRIWLVKKDTTTHRLYIKCYDYSGESISSGYIEDDAVTSTANTCLYDLIQDELWVQLYNTTTTKFKLYKGTDLISTFDKTSNEQPTNTYGSSYSPFINIIQITDDSVSIMFLGSTVTTRVIAIATGEILDLEEFTTASVAGQPCKNAEGYFIIEPNASPYTNSTQSLYKIENNEITLVNTTSVGTYYTSYWLHSSGNFHNDRPFNVFTENNAPVIYNGNALYTTLCVKIRDYSLGGFVRDGYTSNYRSDNGVYSYICRNYDNFITIDNVNGDRLAVKVGALTAIGESKYMLVDDDPYATNRLTQLEYSEAEGTTEEILGTNEQSGGENEEENGSSGGLQQEEDETGLIGG